MLKVFIVRPFGERPVLKKNKNSADTQVVNFDFDKVEKELIKPSIQVCGLLGGTTGEIFAAGNIMSDMFTELLLADIVIADITIHNANVFYELGIRHSLRDKRTILIKCAGFDETPFDIIGYKYLAYKKDEPAEALPDLIRTIRETIEGDRKDSPVFNTLPLLESQDPEKYLAVPEDFVQEVEVAKATNWQGKLTLLASESESFGWHFPALRLIGEALFKIKAFSNAKIIWDKVKENNPYDLQAHDRLATIYQRLGETDMKTNRDEGLAYLKKSDLSIEFLINNTLKNSEKAEAYALKARNAKTRWLYEWQELSVGERGIAALQSLGLIDAFNNYEKGFSEDLNHFYSGINALGLLTVIVSLAKKYPDAWLTMHDTDEEADSKLQDIIKRQQKLIPAVQFSIESGKRKMDSSGQVDHWLNITEADFLCLTLANPARVANMYVRVLRAANAPFYNDATFRQLKIYQDLSVLADNITAALSAISVSNPPPTSITHNLLFTGHMIDKPDRKVSRFPASKEDAVRKLIKDIILEEKSKIGENGTLFGIAGGACGGDILFHEVCEELDIRSRMHLALPRDLYVRESVAFAGGNWIKRFDKLFQKLPHPILSEKIDLPKWLAKKPNYDIWSRNNLWELNSALENGGANMTLISLWDGKGGDGPGGTEHMVAEAQARGATLNPIDMNLV